MAQEFQKIGFIGLGVMGASMAAHLRRGGFELAVYNRTAASAQPLLDLGATWADSPRQLAESCDAIITIVGYPADVEALYLGDDGLVAHARPGTLLIDMTTSSPALALRIAEAAEARGVSALDAPVSGGDTGAAAGTLSIMVGGDEASFQKAMPLFELMGRDIHLQGGPGAGQHTKMVNQILISSGMIAICEALLYAKKAGLDPRKVLESVSKGAAASWTLSNRWPQILEGNYKPGFYVKHFIKDMGIALQSAREMGLSMPGLELAEQLYRQLAEQGGADDGTQALYKIYDVYPVGRRLKH